LIKALRTHKHRQEVSAAAEIRALKMKNNPENRYHIRGLDKLTARPLASYPTPETAKAALAMQASVHEQHRLDAVAQEIVLVCALAASKVISGHDMITVAKAWPQWGKGTKKDNTVAAHCLPGRILLNARPIDNLSEWLSEDSLDKCGIKALPMASTLRNLHGRTDVVDLIVNQVDSRLEIMTRGRGLKPLLAATVNRVVRPCRLEGNVNLPMTERVSSPRAACLQTGSFGLAPARQRVPIAPWLTDHASFSTPHCSSCVQAASYRSDASVDSRATA
jgi:hypothetical protein